MGDWVAKYAMKHTSWLGELYENCDSGRFTLQANHNDMKPTGRVSRFSQTLFATFDCRQPMIFVALDSL